MGVPEMNLPFMPPASLGRGARHNALVRKETNIKAVGEE